MLLPVSNLDDSALFEKALAMQLNEISPPVDLTQVDLSPFLPLKAKVDCITICWPPHITAAELAEMETQMKDRLQLPKDPTGSRFITIHDPVLDDFRYLIKHFPKCRIDYFEVAVDAHLPDGSNDMYLLRQLKEQIRHCIAPQAHVKFNHTKREYWNSALNRWSSDAVTHAAPLTTIHYEDRRSGFELKIYVKSLDQGESVGQPYIRTELSFNGAAPGWAGMEFVDELPNFAKNLRKYCSPAFFIGCGFKNGDVDDAKWKNYGAAWVLKSDKGLHIRADAVVNRAFGDALNNLGRSLQRL
jgi:hypothetical protein